MCLNFHVNYVVEDNLLKRIVILSIDKKTQLMFHESMKCSIICKTYAEPYAALYKDNLRRPHIMWDKGKKKKKNVR